MSNLTPEHQLMTGTCTANESFYDFIYWYSRNVGLSLDGLMGYEDLFWCLPVRPSSEADSCD